MNYAKKEVKPRVKSGMPGSYYAALGERRRKVEQAKDRSAYWSERTEAIEPEVEKVSEDKLEQARKRKRQVQLKIERLELIKELAQKDW